MVRRPALHHRGLPLLLGRRRQQQGASRRPARRSSSWSTASRPRSRSSTQRTIKYSWDKPNPYFIESQARAAPLFLFRPAHYLKKFHAKYTDRPRTSPRRRKGGQSNGNWVQIYRRLDVMFANDNPDLPTLNPWVNTTASPAQRYVFVRNPYYHRIDEKGQQLPYVDRVIFTQAATNLVPAKAGLGEADLQPRYLNMRDYTFLKKSAKSSGVDVRLWESGSGSQIALYPNLNANDEEWRKLMRDVRFRRALSLAIDREEMNEVVYIGLAKPSNNTIMERSTLFKPEYASKWAQYDPKLANKLLDEVGLTKRDGQGFRLLPDGRPATIVDRACQRGDRGRRRPASDRRDVEEDRHQDAGQAADPRELPPAHLLRRGDHDGLTPAS